MRSISPVYIGYRYSFLFIPFLLPSCQLSDSLSITTYPSIPFSPPRHRPTLSRQSVPTAPTTPTNLLHLPYHCTREGRKGKRKGKRGKGRLRKRGERRLSMGERKKRGSWKQGKEEKALASPFLGEASAPHSHVRAEDLEEKKEGGLLLSRIALQYHRRRRA